MRESMGSTNPRGAMKVKAPPRGVAEVGSRPPRPGALPARLGDTSTEAPGGARAYTLGPERW